MARPRKDSDDPSAKERMMQAFWEVLEEKPYAQMTVSDIARAANVRRNTFYYHYANVGELAEQAIRQYIPLAVQNINVMRSGGPDSHFPPLFPPDAQGKIALIAGPHGAMDLLNIVKNIAWDLWVSEFGVDESKRPLFEYAISGMMAASSYLMRFAPEQRAALLANSDLPAIMSATLRQISPTIPSSPTQTAQEPPRTPPTPARCRP
ncbi:MAG TPA: TetR/AcrR family transcriptional regulator [Candidatus Rubneribacter avistercoris]|nr:TetR/AcrR family transcriptional regulator [Candidatus Rubneribacter avistercoris]